MSNLVCPEKWRLPQPRVLSPGSRGQPETSQSGAGLFRGRTCSRQVGASRAAVLLRRASITMARSPRGLAGGERQAARRWMQAQLGGQVSGRSAPAARAAGAPRVESWRSSHKARRNFGELSPPRSPHLRSPLRARVSAISRCPPGRAEPRHFAGGAGCCQWQRRMTYLLACQNLPCLWKSHPAKQNSLLPIGSGRGAC